MEQRAVPDRAGLHSQVKGYETLAQSGPNGNLKLSVLVNGAHCAACIQKIESSVKHYPEVTHARLNFSTGLLTVEWLGSREIANDFVSGVEKLGYAVSPYDLGAEKESMNNEERFLLLCLGVAGFSMGNIMLLSIGLWTTTAETMGMATRDFMHWISALIAIPTIIYAGRPFFRSALAALKAKRTNMDVPISVGLILTGSMSLFETIHHGEHAYFDSAVMLIFLLLIGRYFDFRARKKAQSSAAALLSSLTGFATIMENGLPRQILVRDIVEGQILRVASGDKFAADGKVVDGISDIDLSIVTGETIPVTVEAGSDVYAGTVNLSAPLLVKVTKKATNSLLADIARLLEKATQSQAHYVRIADRAAKFYTPVVHTLALMTFLIWWGVIGLAWQQSLMIAITVLIITCPCALGLAVPVVQVLATNKLMQQGVLVKSGDALERLAAIDSILMDKTGTLTAGKASLLDDADPEYLAVAASLAAYSNHPLSKALTRSYHGVLLNLDQIKEHPGQGLEGRMGDKIIRLGSRKWCGNPDAPQSSHLELWLDLNGEKKIAFYFADQLRGDSRETIARFQKNSLSPVLLSGDREAVVADITEQCAIATFKAEQTPAMKLAYLESLKNSGHKVLMVGDGLNDAPTLAAAHVSMAPGTAIDIAQNAADIVFMGTKFMPVYETFKIASLTQKLVKENFVLAVIYNAIAIPVAALGFLTPLIAAIAMSGSSLIVILNSFRVVRKS
jgi:Cu2+-exporting ATPase